MGIFIGFYYFLRSIFLRGLINTILLFKDERKYENALGIQTAEFKKSQSPNFFHYQGAGYAMLYTILPEVFLLSGNLPFVDIGSGKGRALFVAEQCGFKNLTGIELDESLVAKALINLKQYQPKHAGSEFHFVCANALDYSYPNQKAVYFLFNPFSEMVLQQVVASILNNTQHQTWIIYMNPKFSQAIETQGFTKHKTFKTRFYTEAIVYLHEPRA